MTIRRALSRLLTVGAIAALVILAFSARAYAQTNEPGGLLEEFNARDAGGTPISHYDLMADDGGWTDWGRKITYTLMSALFTLVLYLVGFAVWLLDWALRFQLVAILFDKVEEVAATLHNGVIERIGLPGFLLTLAAAWMAWQVLFKSKARGFAEGALSVLVAAVGATLLASPAVTLLGDDGRGGIAQFARCFTLGIAALPLESETDPGEAGDFVNRPPQPPPEDIEDLECSGSDGLARPISNALVDTFVRKPHQLINYGAVFDGNEDVHPDCLAAYEEIVAGGPWGDDGDARDIMGGAGPETTVEIPELPFPVEQRACEAYAAYNDKPNWEKVIAALLTLVAALIVTVLVVLVAGGYLVAQLWLVFEVVRGVFALPIGILPGPGRRVLWQWVGGILRAVLGILVSLIFLAVFAVFLGALLAALSEEALIVLFVTLDVAVFAALVFHRRLLAATKNAGAGLAARLSGRSDGGGGSWVRPPAGPAPNLSFAQEGRGEMRRVYGPAVDTARRARQVWVGPPEKNKAAVAKVDSKRGGKTGTSSSAPAAVLGPTRRLQRVAYGTRGGRVVWRTASAPVAAAAGLGAVVYGVAAAGRAGTRTRHYDRRTAGLRETKTAVRHVREQARGATRTPRPMTRSTGRPASETR